MSSEQWVIMILSALALLLVIIMVETSYPQLGDFTLPPGEHRGRSIK